LNAKLYVTGSAYFRDDVFVLNGFNAMNIFTVDPITGIATQLGDWQVLGKTLLNDLEVSSTGIFQQLQVVGPSLLNVVEVQGPAVFDSTVLVKGLLTATGGLAVSEIFANSGTFNLVSANNLTTQNLTSTSGTISQLSSTTAKITDLKVSTFNATGPAVFDSTVLVKGLLTATGGLAVSEIFANSGTFNLVSANNLTSLNLFASTGTLGYMTVQSGAFIDGGLNVGNIFTVDPLTWMTTLAGGLQVLGPTLLNDLQVSATGVFQNLEVVGLALFDNTAYFSGGINVTGASVFHNNVTVEGLLVATGGLEVKKIIVDSITAKTGSIDVLTTQTITSQSVTSKDLVTTNLIATGTTILNTLQVQTIDVTGPATFHSTVKVEGLLVATGGLAVSDLFSNSGK